MALSSRPAELALKLAAEQCRALQNGAGNEASAVERYGSLTSWDYH